MNSIANPLFRAMNYGLLYMAFLLAPTDLRKEWLREWKAELWHIIDARIEQTVFCWQAQRDVTAFCLGAFADARCLRHQAPQQHREILNVHSSATQCLLWLILLFSLCAILSSLLPGIRAEYDT